MSDAHCALEYGAIISDRFPRDPKEAFGRLNADHAAGAAWTRVAKLRKRRELLVKQLAAVGAEADRLLNDWGEPATARELVEERIGELAVRRDDISAELEQVELQTAEIDALSKSSDVVVEALLHLDEVYKALHPNERKELFRLLLRRIEVRDEQIVLEIYAGAGAPQESESSRRRTESVSWLPGLVSQSVIRDVSRLPRAA